MSESGPLLDVQGATVSYSGLVAVRDVSVHVGAGEVAAVVGLNGAGKSSLLRGVSGLVPMSGSLRLAGQDLGRLTAAERASMGLGHVPEGRRLFPRMSVLDNLRIGGLARAEPLRGAALEAEVERVIPPVVRLLRQRADSLSGGEQQLVAIGRALMAQPRVLMLDEPSLGLSPIATQGVARTIEELAASGTGVLLAEQNVNLALRLARRIYILAFGAVVDVVEVEPDAGDASGSVARDIYRSITHSVG